MSDETDFAGIWIQLAIAIFLTVIIVYMITTIILAPIMGFSISEFPSEKWCHSYNESDIKYGIEYSLTKESAIRYYCFENETGWHRNSQPLVLH